MQHASGASASDANCILLVSMENALSIWKPSVLGSCTEGSFFVPLAHCLRIRRSIDG